MSIHSKAAITVLRPLEEVRQAWSAPATAPPSLTEAAAVTFEPAPGDRGTEIHVDVGSAAGRVRVLGRVTMAKVKDELRRFKAQLETGDVPRSEAVPEGEKVERKFRRRPAQPLQADELERAGAR